jgi:hypothetical protein
MKYIFLFLFPLQLFSQQKPILFKNVNIVDVQKGKVIANQHVFVEGTRIKKISTKPIAVSGATVVNGSGKFLIPSLWDSFASVMDSYFKGQPVFELYTYFGICWVRDMGVTNLNLATQAKLKKDIEKGSVLGPKLIIAGKYIAFETPIAALNNKGNRYTIPNKTLIEQVIDSLYKNGADYINIHNTLHEGVRPIAIKAAHKRKLPVVGWVIDGYDKASNQKLDALQHIADIYRSTSTKRSSFAKMYLGGGLWGNMFPPREVADTFFATLRGTRDTAYYNYTISTLAKNKTHVITNLNTMGRNNSRMETMDPFRMQFRSEKQIDSFRLRYKDSIEYKADAQLVYDIISDFHKAGIPLVAGSAYDDFSTQIPGISLINDMELLVKCGLTPAQALQSATILPARLFKKDKVAGSIQIGKGADLVLLHANPLEDISNTRKINAVVANGRLLTRKDLDKLLEDAKKKVLYK